MKRIFTQNGIVWGSDSETTVCAVGSVCYDITDGLREMADKVLGPQNRQSCYTFAGGLMVTGRPLDIAGVAQTFENFQTLSRQKAEIQDQFNHLSEQLAQVAAKLTETEAALGRAHDLVAVKQARIDELEKAVAPASAAMTRALAPAVAYDYTDVDAILKRDWPTNVPFKEIAAAVRKAAPREMTDKDIRNRVTRLGLKRPVTNSEASAATDLVVPLVVAPADASQRALTGISPSAGERPTATEASLSPLALRFGDSVMAMADEGSNPDEIAKDLNFGLKRNDHLNAAMVKKIMTEMRAKDRLAGAA